MAKEIKYIGKTLEGLEDDEIRAEVRKMEAVYGPIFPGYYKGLTEKAEYIHEILSAIITSPQWLNQEQ